jgi:hypothetical protein
MKYNWLLLAAAGIVVGSGCGGSQTQQASEDPATVYARTTKIRVLEFVQEAKKRPKSLGQGASVLLETLEVHPNQAVGEHKNVYELLTRKCKELVDLANRSPGSAEIHKKLNEMAALANQLPGELPPPDRESS